MLKNELEIPFFYDPEQVGVVWRVPYQERAEQARELSQKYQLSPAGEDPFKVSLILVDVQNTFCIPGFELFVGGRSGTGAVDDNQRLCNFIYRNLANISEITPTMDTHQLVQIFHAIFLVDKDGVHPEPHTLVSVGDIENGRWQFNAEIAPFLGTTAEDGQRHLGHYVRQLAESKRYALTIWPYHAMLGGIGHALVSAIEEAIFFHSVARCTQPDFEIKGFNPFTEHYSVLGPEVQQGAVGEELGERNPKFIQKLKTHDAVVIAGQAKSHCVAFTIRDLLDDIMQHDPALANKVYLLEDCTSPVVVPDVIDYTQQADEAFWQFEEAGMHLVQSSKPMREWPGLK
jgi:nicotinamidase-related amidase